VYNKVPRENKPSPTTTKLTYVGSFEPEFSIMLRERRLATLIIMQDGAIDLELEGNGSPKPPQGVMRNPTAFRRPFNPHIMPREGRNEKQQPIHPPVRDNNNNYQEDVYGKVTWNMICIGSRMRQIQFI